MRTDGPIGSSLETVGVMAVVGVGRARWEALILKCCLLIRAEGPGEGAVGVGDVGSSDCRWRVMVSCSWGAQ